MDFSTLLFYHSYYRWVVLLTLLAQFVWLYVQQRNNKVFTATHYYILLGCTLVYDVQLVLGILLYTESMLVKSFWNDISLGVKNRQVRFFGLEHVFMMTLGVFLINLYTVIAYRKRNQTTTFRYLWSRYIWIQLIILSSIPWAFSPLTSRPNFR